MIPVTKPSPTYLKIYTEEAPDAAGPGLGQIHLLPNLLKAFREATGWSLQLLPRDESVQSTDAVWSTPIALCGPAQPTLLTLNSTEGMAHVDQRSAEQLAATVADVLGELTRARHALWQREAELAAGVPLVPHPADRKHVAERLQAVLKGGAEAVGCQAAALYLLDDATTELKVRSVWGLPLERLTNPARPLKTALADLEAMLGHAVVVDDTSAGQRWNPPEQFPASVCVPISSATTILGTLWLFSEKPRDFSDHQTNIIEVVAGRLAAELEREVLLREGIDGARLKRQLAAAERLQRNQLPTIAPVLDGWDVAGWTAQAETVGGDFYDWFCLGDGHLLLSVGDAMSRGIEAALAASALKAALRAHGQYQRQLRDLLTQANLTVWTGSAGDQYASLFVGLAETSTGRVHYASAGEISIVHLSQAGWRSLSYPSPHIGESPEADYPQKECLLEPGNALLAFTTGVRDARGAKGVPMGEAALAGPLAEHLDRPAEELVALARDRLEAHAKNPDAADRTVVVLRRT